MNYSGSIAGIQLSDIKGSMFTAGLGIPGNVWSAEVAARILANEILLEFRYAGDKYGIELRPVNNVAFQGAISKEGQRVGDIYAWWFKNAKEEYLLQCDWSEDGYGTCECLIKLRPSSEE